MIKMKTKICPICKNKFTQNIHNQKLCSKKCVKKYKRIYRGKYHILKHPLEFKYKQLKGKLFNKGIKICIKCKIKKYLKDFYLRKEENIFRAECKKCYRIRKNNYYQKHRVRCLRKMKRYYQLNKTKIFKNISEKMKINVNFRLLHYLRTRINAVLNRKTKLENTIRLLGCSIDFLKHHLESQFTKGMSWDSHGNGWNGKGMQEWHIDHIKPCSMFDFEKKSEQRKCFHYTNLRPLWAKKNLSRSKYGE